MIFNRIFHYKPSILEEKALFLVQHPYKPPDLKMALGTEPQPATNLGDTAIFHFHVEE